MSWELWTARVVFALVGLGWTLTALDVAAKRKKGSWRVGPDSPGPEGRPSLAIVIPARNEEGSIRACVEAALAQDLDDVEVVVLDDGSTDRTPEILAELAAARPDRLRVVRGGDAPLPPGWLGKPWACQRAARHARAEWLLFVDADVRLHPHAAAAALGWAQAHDLGLVSGLGHLETGSFWEKVLQPAIGAVIMAGNDLDKVNDPQRRSDRPLANGQFMLFRRDAYEAVGGHEAVAGAVLDDVGMATAVVGAGFHYNVLVMRDLFSCRMYDGLGPLWEGWTKNLFTGIRRSWGVLVFLTVWLSLYTVVPFLLVPLGLLGLVGPELLAWGLGLSGLILLVRAWLDHVYGMDLRYGPTQPLAVTMLLVLFWHSAIRTVRGTTRWKGRALALDPGEAARTTTAVAEGRVASTGGGAPAAASDDGRPG